MSVRWTYAFLDRPASRFEGTCAFWTAVTGTGVSEPTGEHGEFVTLSAEDADACLGVQRVLAGEGGVHLDFSVDDVAGVVAAALRLGARTVAEHERWAVLRSPAGQSFCVLPWQGESVRPPVVHGSRLDQVCLDSPPSLHHAEVVFWGGLLDGWESVPGKLPEFHVVRPPSGLPVRLLLQRLGEERPGSAHPDLACADVAATRTRHEALGAGVVAAFDHWTVMRDPEGGVYCLTGRDTWTGGSAAPPGQPGQPEEDRRSAP